MLNWELLGRLGASLVAQMVQNLPAMQGTGLDPWVGKILWKGEWQPTPVFLPGESHGQRSLAGYRPWGHKESDRTERLTLSLFGRLGYVDLDSIDIWGWVVLCCGGAMLCTVGCLAASLPSHLQLGKPKMSPDCQVSPGEWNCPHREPLM